MTLMDVTFGAMLDGVLMSFALYGITCIQVLRYYQSYPEDSLTLKVVVAAVWMLDTLQECLLVHAIWFYLITQGNGNPFALLYAVWSLIAQVIPSDICIIIVELFYIRRIWILHNRDRRISILPILAVAALVIGFVYVAKCFRFPAFSASVKQQWIVIVSASCRAVVDLTIAVMTCRLLYQSRKRVITEKVNSLIGTLIGYTMATGLLTSIVAVLYVGVYVAMPFNMIYIAIYFVHAKIYVNSMLSALNSRATFRELIEQDIELQLPASMTLGQESEG
ncbi:hypothetical protein JAAARDRAFT_39898 [Jaapia argillacea MUCL 33604]|uniref:DUF6534 domain-containing protein n=1 Tax=Jaapia argillacea MUCL 33604 TaxID=933084 RepID=A0A067PQQ1_9AGAM|nr:hypothetical protein JAAARDRAFT_39898 [Jaapia argillacea MUCL 33604]